jgi:ribonuclease HI
LHGTSRTAVPSRTVSEHNATSSTTRAPTYQNYSTPRSIAKVPTRPFRTTPRVRPYSTTSTDCFSHTLYFDGASRGNPGASGSGSIILRNSDEETVWESYKYLGTTSTNNVAEYSGLLEGLRGATRLSISTLLVKGDSMLVLKQVEGSFQVKAAHLAPFVKEARTLLKVFSSVRLVHIPRALNSLADSLANAAVDTRDSKETTHLT